jgi:GcrA cell cycle regulator
MAWNDAAVAILKDLYEKGLSASRIANKLNLGFSRNAVIGKINRLGLIIEKKKAKAVATGQKPKPPRSRVKAGYSGIEERYTPYLPPEPVKPETMKCCTLLQLTNMTCRFPIGDPKDADFHFCGNDIAGDGCVYCAYHTRISYTTPAQRRAEQAANQGPPNYGTQT